MPSLYVRLSKFLHSLHLVFLLTSFPLIKKTPFRWYQSFGFSILSPFILITSHGGLFIKETLNIQNYSIKREMSKLPRDVISLLYSMLIASFSSKVLRLCIAPIFNPHIAICFSNMNFAPVWTMLLLIPIWRYLLHCSIPALQLWKVTLINNNWVN
jgi:hypothetical protein